MRANEAKKHQKSIELIMELCANGKENDSIESETVYMFPTDHNGLWKL